MYTFQDLKQLKVIFFHPSDLTYSSSYTVHGGIIIAFHYNLVQIHGIKTSKITSTPSSGGSMSGGE